MLDADWSAGTSFMFVMNTMRWRVRNYTLTQRLQVHAIAAALAQWNEKVQVKPLHNNLEGQCQTTCNMAHKSNKRNEKLWHHILGIHSKHISQSAQCHVPGTTQTCGKVRMWAARCVIRTASSDDWRTTVAATATLRLLGLESLQSVVVLVVEAARVAHNSWNGQYNGLCSKTTNACG